MNKNHHNQENSLKSDDLDAAEICKLCVDEGHHQDVCVSLRINAMRYSALFLIFCYKY